MSDVLARYRHILNFKVEENVNFTILLHLDVYLDVYVLLHDKFYQKYKITERVELIRNNNIMEYFRRYIKFFMEFKT